MRRQLVPTLLVTLLLSSVIGFAYFSNHPESPWLERAQSWPVVGPVASWFRTAYLPPEDPKTESEGEEGVDVQQPIRITNRPNGARRSAPPAESPREAGSERPVTPEQRANEEDLLRAAGLRRAEPGASRDLRPDPRTPKPAASEALRTDPTPERRTVEISTWELVRPGLDVRVAPKPDASVRLDLPAMSYLPVLSRQANWAEVLVGGERGWIDLNQEPPFNRRRARRGILRHRAEPVQPNDGFVLKEARKLLGIKKETGSLGPYALYSDVEDEELLDLLDRAASLAEESYFARYGRLPSGDPRRSVMLFAREETYRQLAMETSNIPGGGTWQAGHAGRGVLGMFVEGRSFEVVAGTLVHEIAHLLNDRSLAYELPIWLEEGIAGDLGAMWVEPDPNRQLGRRFEIHGADSRYLSLREILRDGRGPPLANLLSLDRDNFYSSALRQHAYALSFAFVRYLLDGEDSRHADGFRAFLGRIAAGMGANLIEQLGVDGAELEAGFYRWLTTQIEGVGIEIERRARGR